MPRDGQHYFEAVNTSRSLIGWGWTDTPPQFVGWGDGEWGNFPWGGQPNAIGADGSPWEFQCSADLSGADIFVTAYFTEVPSMTLFFHLYAMAANDGQAPAAYDTRLRYGGSVVYVGGMGQNVTDLVKKAGAYCPGLVARLVVEVGLPGHAPFRRYPLFVRVPA